MRGCLDGLLKLAGVLLVLMIIGAALDHGNGAGSQSGAGSGSITSAGSSSAPIPTRAPTATPVPSATPVRYGIGDAVASGNWRYQVTRAGQSKSAIAGALGGGVAKGIWTIVWVTVTNIGRESYSLHEWDFELHDSDGITYKADIGSGEQSSQFFGLSPLGDDLPPGVPVNLVLLFDTNPAARGLMLYLVQSRLSIDLSTTAPAAAPRPTWTGPTAIPAAEAAAEVIATQEAEAKAQNTSSPPTREPATAQPTSTTVPTPTPLPTATPRPSPTPPPSPTPLTSLQKAELLVRQKLFDSNSQVDFNTSGYNESQQFRVLIAPTNPGSGGERAYFFVGDQFVGIDSQIISQQIAFEKQEGSVITLHYTLYHRMDPGMPVGGKAAVRFQWNGSSVVPLDPIPTADWNADLSR